MKFPRKNWRSDKSDEKGRGRTKTKDAPFVSSHARQGCLAVILGNGTSSRVPRNVAKYRRHVRGSSSPRASWRKRASRYLAQLLESRISRSDCGNGSRVYHQCQPANRDVPREAEIAANEPGEKYSAKRHPANIYRNEQTIYVLARLTLPTWCDATFLFLSLSLSLSFPLRISKQYVQGGKKSLSVASYRWILHLRFDGNTCKEPAAKLILTLNFKHKIFSCIVLTTEIKVGTFKIAT